MSSTKVPEIRVYSPPVGKTHNLQHSSRFTWNAPKGGGSSTLQAKSSHQQPLRFFGSNSHFWFTEGVSGKRDFVKEEMVKWENTFNMRAYNLNQFSANNNYRSTFRSQAVALQRARTGFVSGTAKSLDILRQNLQNNINKEIDDIIQKYLRKFFKLAIENIKYNNGEQAVSEQHVQTVCRQILEEAKKMYQGSYTSNSVPSSDSHEAEATPADNKPSRPVPKVLIKKRKDSDTDSEASFSVFKQKKKKGRPPVHYQGGLPSGRSTPMKMKTEQIKREGPKWDPARLTSETLFIMGAKANKALGLGATRGRLYIKHPDIFKYSGDQEDKQWLYDHSLMPATGGKAYMLLVEDIQELAQSDEYRNNPALMSKEIVGFTIPETMLQKMRTYMQQMRADAPIRKRGRPPVTNTENNIKMEDTNSAGKYRDSGAGTPTDELELMSGELPSTDRSPFNLGTGFDDMSSAQADISPTPSDMSATLDPPMTASFEVTATP